MGGAEQAEGPQGHVTWLNAALMQRAAHSAGECSEVADIDVALPLAAGENYVSTIYRVKATLANGKERSFIVKGPAGPGVLAFMAEESGVFQREITMLTDIIPQMEALLEEAAPGRFPGLAARCFHHGAAPVPFLVLEDLAPAGYKMADRARGAGLRHGLLATRALARFHAASHALLRRRPELLGALGSIFSSKSPGVMSYVLAELQALANGCREWAGFEDISHRLEKFKSVAGETLDKLNEPNPEGFNVIAHGDFWINNMMFLCEDGRPQEFRAIDLQQSHTCSPAIDLLHFFASSLSEDVYEHHRDLLLREYHLELEGTLRLLGYQAPPLEALASALEAQGAYGLFLVAETPIMQAQQGVDVDALRRGEYESYLRELRRPRTRARMRRLLREYARRGWLPA